jgi:hypothetical protein
MSKTFIKLISAHCRNTLYSKCKETALDIADLINAMVELLIKSGSHLKIDVGMERPGRGNTTSGTVGRVERTLTHCKQYSRNWK